MKVSKPNVLFRASKSIPGCLLAWGIRERCDEALTVAFCAVFEQLHPDLFYVCIAFAF